MAYPEWAPAAYFLPGVVGILFYPADAPLSGDTQLLHPSGLWNEKSKAMTDELQRAAAILAQDERVLAVWGFGSRARGEATETCDVDVAVLLDRPVSLMEELRLRSRVVQELARDDVDLVILNQAPPLLRYEAIAAGCRLFARDEDQALDFEVRAARECWDTAHLREVQQRLAREAQLGAMGRPVSGEETADDG